MTTTDSMVIGLSLIGGTGTINLHDKVNYAVAAEATRQGSQKSYVQITAKSPVLAGTYLVHSSPDMVNEQVDIYCYGTTQTLLNTHFKTLQAAFEQWTYQLQWTFADYTETWNCNAVSALTFDLSQTMIHNYMGKVSLTIPRFPAVQ
jgi:hypothetical protein